MEDPELDEQMHRGFERCVAQGEAIMEFFAYKDLPPKHFMLGRNFATLAIELMRLPRSAERTVSLRKLLEGREAALRCVRP